MGWDNNPRASQILAAMQGNWERQKTQAAKEAAPKKPRAPSEWPTEYQEQAALCDWLKLMRVLYAAIPNGAFLAGSGQERGIRWRQMARIGAKSGVPDLVLFTPPPRRPEARVTVEMKRVKEARPTLSEEQRAWHLLLAGEGWIVIVGYGADDAIRQLTELGYADPHGRRAA